MQKGTFPTNLRTFEGLKTKRAKNGHPFGSCFQISSIFGLKIGNLSILVTQLAYHTFLSPSVIIIYFSTKNTHFLRRRMRILRNLGAQIVLGNEKTFDLIVLAIQARIHLHSIKIS